MTFDPARDFNPYAPPAAATDDYAPASETDLLILAPRGTRFCAYLIDNLLFLVFLVPLLGFVAALIDHDVNPMAILALGLLLCLIFCAYQAYLVSTTGQSLGKRWLDLKIVRKDGAPVDFVSGVVVRSWAVYALCFIPIVGGFIGFIDALMIFNHERECLHDKLAGTKVVLTTRTRY